MGVSAMLFKLCLAIIYQISIIHAVSLNISDQDYGPGLCIRTILSKITKSIKFNSDVSLLTNENMLIKTLQGVEGARYITRTPTWENSVVYTQIYIMTFETYQEMKEGYEVAMKDFYWTPRSIFIVVLQQPIESKHLDEIPRYFAFNNIYNVTILMKQDNDYEIYKFHLPIHLCNYSRQHLVRGGRCSMDNGESYIIPSTITKTALHGCRFKLVARNFYPMINLKNIENNEPEGWEQKQINEFAKHLKITIDLEEYSQVDKFGRIDANSSNADIFKMVRDNEADGAIGGYFLTVEYIHKFSYVYPVVLDYWVLILPQSNILDMWPAILQKAYHAIMISCSLIIIFSVLAYHMELFPSPKSDATRVFLIILGYFLNKLTIREMKKGIPETLLASSLLLWIFIIPNTVPAYMYSVKTCPIRGYESTDLQEIYENYRLLVPSQWERIAWSTNSLICSDRLECLQMVVNSKDKKDFTVISATIFDIYKWIVSNDQCTLNIYKLRYPVPTVMRTVYFRHGSVLSPPFDRFLQDFSANGLILLYYRDLEHKERLKCKYHEGSVHTSLTLKHLRIAFVTLIAGYFLSAICFTYEIITRK